MNYAIYGAGSLGTVLGAYISEAGTEIDLISRNKAHVDALNDSGAIIEGGIEKTGPVRALTPDEAEKEYGFPKDYTRKLIETQMLEKDRNNSQ